MAEPLWTSAEIADATDGSVSSPFTASGVSIDSRAIEPGDLFVALTGDRDGHDYLDAAYVAGAAGALVSRPQAGPSVQVADTFKALEALGLAARDRARGARRAAVTGSVGKTSVTQAIAAGVKLAGPAHASVKSYNNHIGVPLTLARMPAWTERAVFEIGMNHAGEIGPLSRQVAPHLAVITTVGPVHAEAFPDGVQGIARAKAEIFEGVAEGGLAILNADDGWLDYLSGEAKARGLRVRTFGAAEGADARLTGFEPAEAGAVVHARMNGQALRFPIAQEGAHWGPNSLATLLALEALEVPLDTALDALAHFAPLAGRGSTRRLQAKGGEVLLIDESYNANPLSMRAALKTLGGRHGRRIAVMTDMLELGVDATKHHAELADAVLDAGAERVFLAGPLMRALWDVLPADRRAAYADTAEDLAGLVVGEIRGGDVVMVKGSNGSRAGRIVQALSEAYGGLGEGR